MYQKVLIIGHLGSDPEMRYMPDGTAVTSFSLASSRRWATASGEKAQETTWFRCSVWGKRGETANQYLAKGHRVQVEGRLKPDPNTGGPRLWKRQDGTVAASYEVVVDEFVFLQVREEAGGGDHAPMYEGNGAGADQTGAIEEDDIPF